MAITSLGVGSGLDLEGLLTSLMEVEKRPLSILSAKYSSYETKLSGYSMVQSALSSFQSSVKSLSSISSYQNTSASSSNTDIATISASSKAANSNYALQVSQLAQSQRLVANGLESKTTAVGSGTITIDFGTISGEYVDGKYVNASFESSVKGSLKTIEIDESNNTLEGIRDAINAANAGVTASIVNDGSGTPYRLALTSTSTGETQSMKITVDGDRALSDLLTYDPTGYDPDAAQVPALDDDGNAIVDEDGNPVLVTPGDNQKMQQTMAGQNAKFTLDGIEITKATNTVSDAIEGVTITLLSADDPDKTTRLTVTQDNSGAKTAVESLVKAYNDLNTTLKDLTAYDAETQTASALTGDTTVRSIQTALKGMLSTVLGSNTQGYRTLADVGITVDKDGVMQIDSSKLGEAMEKNFEAFTQMFAEGGMSSNDNITFLDADDNAKPGNYTVDITQVATKGTYAFELDSVRGLNFSGTTAAQRTMMVTVNGTSKSITLDDRDYANNDALASAMASKINEAFKDSGITVGVEVEDGKFTVTSGTWGSESSVKIAETGGLFDNDSKVQTDGLDVEGTINGQAATGNGQVLTGAFGTDAYGIKVQVTGEDKVRGTVSFTQGFSYQFTKLADSLLAEGSAIKSSIEGVNNTMSDINKQYANYEERIAKTEEMYRTKFTNLDVLIAKLNSTSDYLTTQLASLSSLWNQSKSK